MTIDDLRESLLNTYIKNDYGELRAMYVLLCLKCGLHDTYPAEGYKWPWVYTGEIVQHAPERRYVRGKKRLSLEELKRLASELVD